MRHTSHNAFTLVEVMIVIAIIAILAAFAIPGYLAYRNTSHSQACSRNMDTIKTACRTYMINHSGEYTTDLSVLKSSSNGNGLLKDDTRCPIGGNYTITYDSAKQDFTVTCDKANDSDHLVNSP